MRITDCLTPGAFLVDLGPTTKSEALTTLARRMAEHEPAVDPAGLLQALLTREALASTALGEGVAIPHARLADPDRMIAVLGRCKAGVDWDAPDGEPVRLVLLLAGPAQQPGTYLKALAAASRLLRTPQCRRALLAATAAGDVLDVLREEEARSENDRSAA